MRKLIFLNFLSILNSLVVLWLVIASAYIIYTLFNLNIKSLVYKSTLTKRSIHLYVYKDFGDSYITYISLEGWDRFKELLFIFWFFISQTALNVPWNRTRGRTEKWYPLLVTMAAMFSKIPYTKCEVAIINFLYHRE